LLLFQAGTILSKSLLLVYLISSSVRVKRSGSFLPPGNFVSMSLNSSKKGCANASMADNLFYGSYYNKLKTRSTAS
jgi:hypothetical protein